MPEVFSRLLGQNNFIGGFHNFIGDNLFLLAISQLYWRKSNFYWRTGKSTRFFPVFKKSIYKNGAPDRAGYSFFCFI
jgi:hypothetical protein